MAMQVLISVALALAMVVAPLRASAQQPPPDAEVKRSIEERAKAVKGWPGGIVFTCVVTPADLATEPVKQICASAAASANTLAAQAKVKFGQAPDQRSFATAILRERVLGLTVQVSPSDFNAPLAALVVRVFASRPYSDLVSAAATKGKDAAQNPLAMPRAGDVIFWEDTVVGSGPPDKLGPGITPAINDKLRQFFADLAPAPKPAPKPAPAQTPAPKP
ncbi:MAG: hypothetical protein HY060_23715 [Proteobacteria bacterium]|nr:hypothetical protein [Pseudomonadota bacterium]